MSSGRSALILVVDDNEAGQLLVRSVLELDGFLVETASSSQEVLELLSAHRPDLILMDVQLPGQDGLRIREGPEKSRRIPIVALTAHAMAGDRELALAAGCIAYISKPIDTRVLGDQVRGFLSAEPIESGVEVG